MENTEVEQEALIMVLACLVGKKKALVARAVH